MISVSILFEDDSSIQKNFIPKLDQKENQQTILGLIKKPIKKIQNIFIGNPDFSGTIAGSRG